MGLGDMVKNVFHTFGEMKEMTKLQEELTKEIQKLHESGKCPAPVYEALEKLTAATEEVKKETDSKAASKKSLEALNNFVNVLKEHKDELPDHLKEVAEKFSLDTADVEKLTEKFMK